MLKFTRVSCVTWSSGMFERLFARWTVLSVLAVALGPALATAAPITLPFDAAYTVAAAGSVERIDSFSLDGPAPWLYVDLPDGALNSTFSSAYSRWFAEGSPTVQFTASDGIWGSQDKYWLSPAASAAVELS